jgi:hypothetical protein
MVQYGCSTQSAFTILKHKYFCLLEILLRELVRAHHMHRNIQISVSVLNWLLSQQDKPEISGGTKHFMAFGGGLRFCVGTDLSRVLMATFIHSLVTKYDWRTVKGGNVVRTPGLSFPDGFHIQLVPRS